MYCQCLLTLMSPVMVHVNRDYVAGGLILGKKYPTSNRMRKNIVIIFSCIITVLSSE